MMRIITTSVFTCGPISCIELPALLAHSRLKVENTECEFVTVFHFHCAQKFMRVNIDLAKTMCNPFGSTW